MPQFTKVALPKTDVLEVITALGGTVIPGESRLMTAFTYKGWKCGIKDDGPKHKIWVVTLQNNHRDTACRSESDKALATAIHSIAISNTKSAEQIVREIDRRIDWTGLAFYKATFEKETEDAEKYIADSDEIAQRLCLVMNKGINKKRDTSYEVHTPSGSWYGSVMVDGRSTDFHIRGITNTKMAEELCAILVKYQTKK